MLDYPNLYGGSSNSWLSSLGLGGSSSRGADLTSSGVTFPSQGLSQMNVGDVKPLTLTNTYTPTSASPNPNSGGLSNLNLTGIGSGIINGIQAISNANSLPTETQRNLAKTNGAVGAISSTLGYLGPWGAVAGTALKLVDGIGGSLMNNNKTAKAAKDFKLNDSVMNSSSYGGVTSNATNAQQDGNAYRKSGLFGKLFSNTGTINNDFAVSNTQQKQTSNILNANKMAMDGATSSSDLTAERVNNALYSGNIWNNGTVQYGKKGAKIQIKKSHEGKFTEYKARTGETTEEALHSKDPKVRKMANFAKNASKWKHQQGGTIMNPKDYMLNYINSPEYKQRLSLTGRGTQPISNEDLYNTHYAVTNDYASRAIGKPQSNALAGTPGLDVRYGVNNVILNPSQAATTGATMDEIKAHELSHLGRKLSPTENTLFATMNKSADGVQALNQYNQSGSKLDMNTFISTNGNNLHDQRPDENKADLDALRYQMYKNGVYDTSKGNLDVDTLNKALANPAIGNSFTTKRLLQNYKPADIVQLNNTVAANKPVASIPMAQGGAKLGIPKPMNSIPHAAPGLAPQPSIGVGMQGGIGMGMGMIPEKQKIVNKGDKKIDFSQQQQLSQQSKDPQSTQQPAPAISVSPDIMDMVNQALNRFGTSDNAPVPTTQLPAMEQGGVLAFKEGGKNVIVDGALHAHKHDLKSNPELQDAEITEKGIPVVTLDEGGELEQHAEVERDELILHYDLTKQLEDLMKEGTPEAAIEAGKLLAYELVKNTKDSKSKILKNS